MSKFYNRFYKTFMDMPSVIKKVGLIFGNIILPKKKNKYVKWALDNRELFIGGNSVFLDEDKPNFLKNGSNFNTYVDIIKPYFNALDNKLNNLSFEDRMIFLELKHRLPELLLMRVDKMAMSTSVETRVPYLDHNLVEFSFRIPQSLRYRNGSKKYILKEAAKGILPDKIISRKKMGFCGSASNILSPPVVDYAEMVITESEWMNNYFEINTIKPIFDEHRKNKKDHGMKIFTLLNLSLWQKQWFS